MKKALLFLGTFATGFSFAQNCSEIFISEYVEGWGNNKAIEIYNPTANSIDLSQYFISRYSNGATTASSANSIQLTGTIAAYSTHVGVLQKLDPNGTGQEAPIWDSLEVKADAFYCPDYNVSNAFYWNGNDAIVLAKGSAAAPSDPSTVLVDVFGKIGQDPENAVAGTNGWSSVAPYNYTSGNPMDAIVTEDHSMIRKATILVGKNNPAEIFAPTYQFNPLAEYDSIPAVIPRTDAQGNIIYQTDGVTPQWLGNWESLGVHACDCDPSSSIDEIKTANVVVYPNPSNGVFFVKNVQNTTTIEVFNSLGQKVDGVENNAKSILTFNLGSNSGLYLVKLTDVSGNSTMKRVIVK